MKSAQGDYVCKFSRVIYSSLVRRLSLTASYNNSFDSTWYIFFLLPQLLVQAQASWAPIIKYAFLSFRTRLFSLSFSHLMLPKHKIAVIIICRVCVLCFHQTLYLASSNNQPDWKISVFFFSIVVVVVSSLPPHFYGWYENDDLNNFIRKSAAAAIHLITMDSLW